MAGEAGCGAVGSDEARYGRPGVVRHGLARLVPSRRGMAGEARSDAERYGTAGSGAVSQGWPAGTHVRVVSTHSASVADIPGKG